MRIILPPRMTMPDASNWSTQAFVHWLERFIVTLSGPAIAISGIVAGVDILTGGKLMRQQGWLSYVWAISLLITLDFQVLILGAKGRIIYQQSNKSRKQKFWEIVLIVIVAASISYVSIQMQGIMARMQEDGERATISSAASELGINSNALIWERSALVLTLIFLSGWTKEGNAASDTRRVLISAVPTIDEIVTAMTPLIEERMPLASPLPPPSLTQIVGAVTPVIDQKMTELCVTMTEETVTQVVSRMTKSVTNLQRDTPDVTLLLTELTQQMTAEMTRLSQRFTQEMSQVTVTVTEEVTQEMSRQIVPLIEERVTRANNDSDTVTAVTPDIVARLIEDALSRVTVPVTPMTVPTSPNVSQMTARKTVTVTKNLSDTVRDKQLEDAYQAILMEGGRLSGRALAERTGIGRNIAIAWFNQRHGVTNDGEE